MPRRFHSPGKASSVSDNFSFFWNCLKILGINTDVHRDGSFYGTIWRVFCTIFILMASAASIWTHIHNFSNVLLAFVVENYIVPSILISTVIMLFMYFSIQSKTTELKALRKLLRLMPVSRKIVHIFVSFMILMSFASPFILALLYFVFDEERFFSYSIYSFEAPSLAIAFSFADVTLILFALHTVPIVLNCFFCVLCYQWKEVIDSVKDEIRLKSECFSSPSGRDMASFLLKKCRFLWRGTALMRESFSSFLLYVVAMKVCSIYLLLQTLISLTGADEGLLQAASLECGLLLLVDIVYLLTAWASASLVPRKLEELVALLMEMNEEFTFKDNYDATGLLEQRLKLIVKKKPIGLSIGGFRDVPPFLL